MALCCGYEDFSRFSRDYTGRFGGRASGLLEMKELYEAITEGKPIVHEGCWAMATLDACTAMVRSARERREILLSRQISLPR